MIELVYGGRPVPWARPARGEKSGKTPEKQLEHRRQLAKAMQFTPGVRVLQGPCLLEVVFDYELGETCIRMDELEDAYGRAWRRGQGPNARADVDNLEKQVMEAAELAGIVANDVQFVTVKATKRG